MPNTNKIIYRPREFETDATIIRILYDIQLLCGPDTYDAAEGPNLDEPTYTQMSPDPLDKPEREAIAARVAAYLDETSHPVTLMSGRSDRQTTHVNARLTADSDENADTETGMQDVQMEFIWRESRVPQAVVYPPTGTNRTVAFRAPLSQFDAINAGIRLAFFGLVELADEGDVGITEMLDLLASYASSEDQAGRYHFRMWSQHRDRHRETIRQNRTKANEALSRDVDFLYRYRREHGLGDADALDANWTKYEA